MRGETICVGLAILASACHDRAVQTEARPTTLAPVNPHDRLRHEPIPFAPVPGEAVPAHPCGAKTRGPCLFLGWEYYAWAWGYVHSAWFMDTDGREYEFSSERVPPGAGRPENSDPVRLAMENRPLTQADFSSIVAASTALPRRITTAEVAHAMSLVAKSRAAPVTTVALPGCCDCGGATLSAYIFADDSKGSLPVTLEETQCHIRLLQANESPAARELAQWVDRLRSTVGPPREFK
jgi:hypothetical protein